MKQKLEKINKAESWFFEEMNRMDKPLEMLSQKKKTEMPISRIKKRTSPDTTALKGQYGKPGWVSQWSDS